MLFHWIAKWFDRRRRKRTWQSVHIWKMETFDFKGRNGAMVNFRWQSTSRFIESIAFSYAGDVSSAKNILLPLLEDQDYKITHMGAITFRNYDDAMLVYLKLS